jgi:hypothetical protein
MNTKLIKWWALGVSGITAPILFSLSIAGNDIFCGLINACSVPGDNGQSILGEAEFAIFISLCVIFIFSSLMYFLRKEIFKVWFPFGVLYVVVSAVWSLSSGSILPAVILANWFSEASIAIVALTYTYLYFKSKKSKQ